MSQTPEPTLIQGTRPQGTDREVRFASDEAEGHLSAADSRTHLRCWSCGSAFPVSGTVSEDVYYACPHCLSLNQAAVAPGAGSRLLAAEVLPPRAGLAYRSPQKLESLFLKDGDGSLFEIPFDAAARYLVTPERAAELGHAPFPADEGEVQGHHKTAGGEASDPTNWGFHQSWEFGCYFDEIQGSYCVGVHRHPYGDERAVSAVPEDFL